MSLAKQIQEIPKPLLIVGAQGMLGGEFFDLLNAVNLPKGAVVGLGRKQLDVTDLKQIQSVFHELQPKTVINASAYTNVDGAESDRETAYAVNSLGAKNLANACASHQATLVHFSTDQVFDGTTQTPKIEQDTPSPSNYYAETKLLGENEVLKYPDSLVLRVQWLYGKRKDRFTPLKDKATFTPFADQFGAPTWTKWICEIVIQLLSRQSRGLYHLSHDDYDSWAGVFSFVKQKMDLPVELIPKITSELQLPAKRPLFSVLSNKKLAKTLGCSGLGSWKPALEEFLQEKSHTQ